MSFWNVLEEDGVCGRRSSVASTINRLIVKTTTKGKFDKYQHLFQMSSPLETKSQFESDEMTIPAITIETNVGTRQRHRRPRIKNPSYIGHGVVIALVNMICTAYGKSPEDQVRLSKDLCESLVIMKVLSPNFLHIDDQNAVSRFFQQKVMGYIYAHCSGGTDTGSVVSLTNYLQQTKYVEFSHYVKTSLHKICLDLEKTSIPLDLAISQWSRLDHDFEAIEEIGVGGFSTVVKAKNKLDGKVYAIKKIIVPVTAADAIRKGIEEIRILANLTHPNIVRYKHAWVSSVSVNDENVVDDASDLDSTTSSLDQDTDEAKSGVSARPDLVRSVSCNSQFWASRTQKDYAKESKSDESDYGAVVPRRTPMKLPVNVSNQSAKLEVCIMMDLCNCTLQTWFNKHNMCDRLKSDQLKIFHQILEGIAFIHENDIIHRDLKPENIFIECDTLDVKIGDFGLACPDVCSKKLNVNNAEFTSRKHTQGIGTMGYISPEQKNGSVYDHKSDMYSIGVIASELFLFYSKTEQAKAIQSLHDGDDRFFAEYLQKLPEEVEIIKKLLSKDPANRPEAKLVLEHNLLFRSEPDIGFCKTSDGQSAYSSDHVASLYTIISERDDEIVALKSKMAKMEILLQNCVCHSKTT